MNEEQERGSAGTIFSSPFGARFAPRRGATQVREAERYPANSVGTRTRRKLLKTDRLLVFQFCAKSLFSAGRQWTGRNGKLFGSLEATVAWPSSAARGLHHKHLSKEQERRVTKPKNPTGQ
jgi:hypothetical protein